MVPSADTNSSQSDASSTAHRGSYRSGFVFGVLNFMARGGLGVLSAIIVSRVYGIQIIGQFALVSAPVGVLWVLSTVKEQQALIKEITGLPRRHPRVTQLFAAVFTFSAGLTAVISMLIAVACWFVFRGPLNAPELIPPTFVSIAGYAIVSNTGWNIDSIFAAFVAGRQLFWVGLHETLSFIVIALAVSLAWHSVWGLVIATIGASLTALGHRVLAVRPFLRARLNLAEYRIGLGVLPELLRFGLKATPGQIAAGISGQGGIWALGIVAPVAVVGAYSRALTIPQRLQQVSMRITEVLYPTLVGRHTKGEGEGFDRALIDSIRYETIGMLLIAAAIGGAAHSVLAIFGPGFNQAAPALALLMLCPALASITITQTQALWATNRPGLTSAIAILRLTLTVALLVVLTPSIGITGPAIALLAGYMVVVLLNGLALRTALSRPLRATWPLRERWVLVVAYAAGFVVTHLVEQAIPSAGGLLLALLAGIAAYMAALLTAGGVNSRDRHRLIETIEMAHSRRKRWRASEQPQDQSEPTAVSEGR